jgi:RNA polymerase sigma-54 factor
MQMRVGPQLVLAGQLLRASAADLEATIRAEIDDNPALELVHEGDLYHFNRRSAGNHAGPTFRVIEDWDKIEEQKEAYPSVAEQLAAQVAPLISRNDIPLALELVHTLDGVGYLSEPLHAIAGRLNVDTGRLEGVLKAIQECEPPGVGARNLQECLLIQCAYLQAGGVECTLAQRVLAYAWEEFAARRWKQAAERAGLSRAEVAEAAGFISRNLYPYPLNMVQPHASAAETPLLPDLIINRSIEGEKPTFWLEIPGEELFELRLNDQFEWFLRTRQSAGSLQDTEEREWVKERVMLARQFIAAIEQRWGTLRKVGEFLMHTQLEYLLHGPGCLRPITRAEVAASLGLHESTVSRAISDKILQLPDGRLQPLGELFDGSIPVKDAIRNLLSQPAGPLSDRQIAERLTAAGFPVARRTVTKYREQLKIPNAHHRANDCEIHPDQSRVYQR